MNSLEMYHISSVMVDSLIMIDIHELKTDELETALTFRNSMFTSVSLDHWRDMNCTAVVAWEDGEMIGCIPLQFRRQKIMHNVSIPVVYENAVGVAADRRSRGIGTKMIDEAADFIRNRADALMVVRGGEQSDGYRFYRKSGHSDLMYVSSFTKEPESPLPAPGSCAIEKIEVEKWIEREPQLLGFYESMFGRYGGGRARGRGYWNTIFTSHVFRKQGWELYIALVGMEVAGYLVGAYGTWTNLDDLHIYEVMGRDKHTIGELLAVARENTGKSKLIVPSVALANPIRDTLAELGFDESETTPHIMARIVRPDRIFQNLIGAAYGNDVPPAIESASIVVTTPHRTVALNQPRSPTTRIHLQMKESSLCRLLFRRLDLRTALEMEMVRWSKQNPELEDALCTAFTFREWIQWFSDYV